MRLFLDVDGVLLNFESAFARWLNGYFGLGLPHDYETESWFFDDLLEREQLVEAWHAFLEAQDSARLHPLVPPKRFNALAGTYPVHLLTNFPEPHMDKRVRNLERVGMAYESLHYCGLHSFNGHAPQTKATLVDALRRPDEPAVFVDDHPDNCLDVANHCDGVEVWLMSRRFNADFHDPRIRRAEGWEPLFERLGHSGRVTPGAVGSAGHVAAPADDNPSE